MRREIYSSSIGRMPHRDMIEVRFSQAARGRFANFAQSVLEDYPISESSKALIRQILPDPTTLAGGAGETAFSVLSKYARGGEIKNFTAARGDEELSGVLSEFNPADDKSLGLSLAMTFAGGRPLKVGESILNGSAYIQMSSPESASAMLDDLRRALPNEPGITAVGPAPVRSLVADLRLMRPSAGRRTHISSARENWALRKIKWYEARRRLALTEPEHIKVAILDSGIDASHPLLSGRVSRYIYDYRDLGAVCGSKDIVGHGTHVAGIIGAAPDIDNGVGGMCLCNILTWKIFDDDPIPVLANGAFNYIVNPKMYVRALSEALDEGVHVVNLSIGGEDSPSSVELQLFNALLANNTLIVAAMGNERAIGSPISYPAAIAGVFAVGATDPLDRHTQFSNRGSHITCCAPGTAIWSTLPTYSGQTGYLLDRDAAGNPRQGRPLTRRTYLDAWDGTSMATPFVAAALAMYLGVHGKQTIDQVLRDLLSSLDLTPDMRIESHVRQGTNGAALRHHPDYGYGRLNLERLLFPEGTHAR